MRALVAFLACMIPGVASAQWWEPLPPPPPPPAPVFSPQTTTTYDWQSGSRYTTTTRPNGEATVRGYNYNTGATGNTTIKPDGKQRGTDAAGNPWTYNPATGSYMNYGTGQMCTGKGAARVCTGGY